MAKVKYTLAVMGAGGTGSYFLKEVSRQISSTPDIQKQISSMYICDGDIVEEKNLERQCFIMDDVGRSKAAVLGEVLNDTFSLNWQVLPSYVEKMEHLYKLFPESDKIPEEDAATITIPIIIGCVDNHGARLLFEEFFNKAYNCIYFDAGNEFETGEVVFAYKLGGKVISPVRSHYFPEIKKGDTRSRSDISCTELNNVAPQHIYTNMMAGLTLCSGFSSLMKNEPKCGLVFFNSKEMSCEFIPYTRESA